MNTFVMTLYSYFILNFQKAMHIWRELADILSVNKLKLFPADIAEVETTAEGKQTINKRNEWIP